MSRPRTKYAGNIDDSQKEIHFDQQGEVHLGQGLTVGEHISAMDHGTEKSLPLDAEKPVVLYQDKYKNLRAS